MDTYACRSGVGIPLTEDEIIDLYRTNSLISSEEEIEYSYNRPKLENLLSPIEFERIILEKGSSQKAYTGLQNTGSRFA